MPVRLTPVAIVVLSLIIGTLAARDTSHFPVADVRPGMVATGETVFAGTRREPFAARIIGVLENQIGPRRNLILARLEGGPLEKTGVIAGMSGSPVYIDGRLLGAVAYSLGQFSKEPIAGITPIGEMVDLTERRAAAPAPRASAPLRLPVDEASLLADLRDRLRLSDHFADRPGDVRVISGTGLPDAFGLRRIATPMSIGGYSDAAASRLSGLFGGMGLRAVAAAASGQAQFPSAPVQAGDALAVSLVSGDLAVAATGTVTWVDGQRVYAFGHPLVSLGPVSMPMARAYVHTVVPSLLDSFKVSSAGPVIGTLDQDRATAIAGTLGAPPRTIPITVGLEGSRGPAQRFAFEVARDQTLSPTLAFFSLLSVLQSYEREIGGATVAVRGQVKVRGHGAFTLDDAFAGESVSGSAMGYLVTPLALLARTDLAAVEIEGVDVTISASERPRTLAVERVWIDAGRVHPGETVNARVALRPWRSAEIVRTVPIQVPHGARGPLTLVVADATRIAPFDSRDLRQAPAVDTVPQLLRLFGSLRRNNVLYVRLVNQEPGMQISGETLPSLPPSVLGIVEADRSGAGATALRSATVGAWDVPVDGVVTGLRQTTITIEPR
jgi:hypothetical protein